MKIPHIENALENIISTCTENMKKLYPAGIPTPIQERYAQELELLKKSDTIDDFEIFRLLSKEAKKSSTIIQMRGTVIGSFIYFLLGENCFNPLSVHYYCSDCGYFEEVQTHLFGIDLPDKKCPNCGKDILADGFNLPAESVWGNDGKKTITFDYNVSEEFLPFARRVLTSLYPRNTIVPWGMFELDPGSFIPHPDTRVIGIGLAGYAILPSGNTIDDYPDLISYLENGDSCITGGAWELEKNFLKPIRLFSMEHIDDLIQLQRATGIYANELTLKELRDVTWSNIYNTTMPNSSTKMLFHEVKPKTFKHMAALEASSHNSFSWQETGTMGIDLGEFMKMISSDVFKKFPCYTREDFFDCLLETGVERTVAFDVSERIRKGHANSCKFKEEFFALPISEEIKEVAKNYRYLFPRAHCIEYLLIFARLAYYAKVDSRAFSKIVFKKKS